MTRYGRPVSMGVLGLVLVLLACEPASRSVAPSIDEGDGSPSFADTTPRFSPGGSTVVFVRDRSGDSDLFTIDLAGRKARLLADESDYDFDPSFSPDGRQVVFDSSPNGFAQIHLVSIDGSEVQALSDVPDGWATYPAWSPDGERIVYSCGRPNFETSDLCVLSITGEFLGLLEEPSESQELEAAWSPDGSRIAFSSSRTGGRDLYVLRLDTNEVTRLTSGPTADGDPAWAPDGSEIAFTRAGGDGQICVVTMGDPAVECLVEGIQPSWSPDGQTLAFYRRTAVGDRIFLSRPDGTHVEQLT